MSLTDEQMKTWTDLIDWLTTQEEFVIVGMKDNVINARSSVELDEAIEMLGVVVEMLYNSLEGGAPENLQSLH